MTQEIFNEFDELTSKGSAYSEMTDKYMPGTGQGENMAEQLVTAANKIIYRWYNDGDFICGNTTDITSYANWLDRFFPELESVFNSAKECYNEKQDDEYVSNVLIPLVKFVFDPERLETFSKVEKRGDIYKCSGRFEFDDESYESYWDDEEDEY